jgi:hypothetical protein
VQGMADKRMNQFTPATNMEYVYAELADGSQVKIKKSDLFSLLFQVKYSFNGDLNDLKENGIFYTTGDTINGYNTGILLCFALEGAVIQISTSVFNNNIGYRTLLYNNGKWDQWTDWIAVSFT